MVRHYRDVLLCVTGLTPQVVTETVYALAAEARGGGQSRIPDEIRVITTLEGQRRIALSLFTRGGGHGHFDRLCEEYGLDRSRIRFDESSVDVIHDSAGHPLADIVGDRDNAAAADLINAVVREATRADDARVHVSLAGGRKTMGFYAGYALSLYARPQDRLSHVLVNQPFESHPEFFYPPPEPRALRVADRNDYVSTTDAEVRLADIPFVRISDELGDALRDEELSFSRAVSRAQHALERPDLLIDVGERAVWLQGWPVSLSATQFAWLTWFALRGSRGEPPSAFDEAAAAQLRETMVWLEGTGSIALTDALDSALAEMRNGGERNYFDRNRSRLNRALRQCDLSRPVVNRYEVRSFGRRPHTRYGLSLAPEAIRVVGEP